METIQDFEDLLELFESHRVRYLIIGGLAFIYHAKPRYTKDMDLWIDPDHQNVERANKALAEFGSPYLLAESKENEILQLGVAPSRIDLLRDPASAGGPTFSQAWNARVRDVYGRVRANWIDRKSLWEIKRRIDHPRHQEDARVLQLIEQQRAEGSNPASDEQATGLPIDLEVRLTKPSEEK